MIAHDGRDLIGLSANGDQLWRIENLPPPIDWLRDNGDLLFTVGRRSTGLVSSRSIGTVEPRSQRWPGGWPLQAIISFVYAPTALYRLSETPELLKPLDRTGLHARAA